MFWYILVVGIVSKQQDLIQTFSIPDYQREL